MKFIGIKKVYYADVKMTMEKPVYRDWGRYFVVDAVTKERIYVYHPTNDEDAVTDWCVITNEVQLGQI